MKEKVAHHAFSYFLRAYNAHPKSSLKEIGAYAFVSSVLAIKFHDIDENVQILENSNWTYDETEHNFISPLETSKYWKIEREVLLLH